jgi:hypothetical protein
LPLSTFTEAHHDSFGTTIICLYFPWFLDLEKAME